MLFLLIFIYNCFDLGLKPQLVARLSKALKAEENDAIAAENLNESNAETTESQADNNAGNDVNEYASNDSMDIDLADIVVIDEYDAINDTARNDSKTESSSKRVNILCDTITTNI